MKRINFTKKPNTTGQLVWNVDLGSQPFGQIWTFVAEGEEHPFHAKPLHGEHVTFATLEMAKQHMRNLGE